MTLIKRNNGFFPGVPSFFDDFITRDLLGWSNGAHGYGTSVPAVNIKEDEDNFELEVAVPGLKKEDFKIELENDVLVISSEKEVENEHKSDQYKRKEFSYSTFKRTFSLPENKVDGDKVKAKYTDGVLYVTLPKREEAKPKPVRTIDIG
ncbi:MAG: Hsp20/alpha crystallin family protein [Cyclobacteriaceae bacterium]|nr:Hsp20/alpha crystallin family protein [Cyclobacteriaceae bacterium]